MDDGKVKAPVATDALSEGQAIYDIMESDEGRLLTEDC